MTTTQMRTGTGTGTRPASVIETLRERGFVANVSDEEGLRRAMAAGPITAYCGYDPTASSLHVGHLVSVMLLAHLQRAGHRPIALVGGGTGMIGDPTDRASARPLLTEEEIATNVAGLWRQLSRYLDFSEGRALLLNNGEWLLRRGYVEFLRDVGRHFTLNQLMQHETYRKRFEEASLSFIELNYVLLQAYDFLHLYREFGCGLQVGGNDQWFNILAGTELVRRAAGGTAFALTAPLIEAAGGRKMGKTEGNAVWLDSELTSPYEYYQYWRNATDQQVGQLLRIFTFLPLGEIERLERLPGVEINRAKEVLAFEATKLTHGEEEARKAQQTAHARFRGDGADLGPAHVVQERRNLADLLADSGLASSKSDAKRLIKGGGVRLGDEVQHADREVELTELPTLLSVGKRKVRLERE